MSLSRFQLPLRTAAALAFRPALSSIWIRRPEIPQLRPGDLGRAVEGSRSASVKAQGVYRIRRKKTIPKKMGVKRTGDQYVIPGNIIYKQRGTIWHPGENTIMGRNHTIHAAIHGYVKYYRDPAKHPDRQYIGVTHERHETLPYPVHGVRRRKLNMIAIPIKEVSKPPLMTASGIPRHIIRTDQVIGEKAKNPPQARAGLEKSAIRVLNLQDNYGYAESNAAIGRLMPKISFSNWKARVKDLETRNRKTPSKRTKAAAMP